ncbi:MAG: SCP2 sterol-binding domain-containing protein [Defluviitaleaceae bacterium]|nr:SCP2 sterol-binding domain-containing protein [Defluviitaleaceae bacterium]
MEIVYLFGGIKSYDTYLTKVTNLVSATMLELGINVKEINLGPPVDIPYYAGIKNSVVTEFLNIINNADGVIFATNCSFTGLSPVFHTFFEYIEADTDIIKDKNCMTIVVSKKNIISYDLPNAIKNLGAFDSVRSIIDEYFFDIESNKEILEKQVEDFYRIIRQKRKFYNIKSQENAFFSNNYKKDPKPFSPPVFESKPLVTQGQVYKTKPDNFENQVFKSNQNIQNTSFASNQNTFDNNKKTQNIIQNYNTLNEQKNKESKKEPKIDKNQSETNINNVIDSFNQKQNEDIMEITNFFTSRDFFSSNSINSTNMDTKNNNNTWDTVSQNNDVQKTPRQLTKGLVHYYQPQLSNNLICAIQLNVEGINGFDGYFLINNKDCEYYDGVFENPSVTIISNEINWLNIVTGKISAQKSFMTGNIKIKGNFVLITKFDQMFNISKNY